MTIFINATACHADGGKVLLLDLLYSAKFYPEIDYHVFIDKRFRPVYTDKNINYKIVSKPGRLKISLTIKSLIQPGDIILCYSNLPPLLKFENKVILLQSNRFLIDHFPMKGFGLMIRSRLLFEKVFFNLYKENVDHFIVQSETMKNLLVGKGISSSVIKILPLKNEEVHLETKSSKIKNSFLYVASFLPHKNHRTLLEAWKLLGDEDIRPPLFLTVQRSSEIAKLIEKEKSNFQLDITILDPIDRIALLEVYQKVEALIYPSKFESYGLPLIEASRFGLTILASELDYVRDLVDPDFTFDPDSSLSIKRAVKRYLKLHETKSPVISGKEFISEIIQLSVA
jgi:glycosyltransferase involved in cell wall biosynthesis